MKRHIGKIGKLSSALIPAALLFMIQPAHAQAPLPHVFPISGTMRIIRAGQPPITVTKRRILQPGEQVETGPDSQVLISFSGQPGCRIVLDANSKLLLIGANSPQGNYQARLQSGSLWCQVSAQCTFPLEVDTPVARLRGRETDFWVQTTESTSTVVLKSGRLRLIVRDQTIPLRAMTRTTISNVGNHRIASIFDKEMEAWPGFNAASFGFMDSSSNSISPVSAPGRP